MQECTTSDRRKIASGAGLVPKVAPEWGQLPVGRPDDGGAVRSSAAAAGPPLGTITKFVRRSPRAVGWRLPVRLERYELQAVARVILPKSRLRVCMLCASPVARPKVMYSPQRQAAHLTGLMVCGSVWVCPVCAGRVSERRRGEVARAVSWARDNGLSMVLATFTLSHAATDSLSDSLEALNAAYLSMRRRRDYASLQASYGLTHSIKALEVTWGEAHGFHPHLHVLYTVPAAVEASALRSDLAGAWLPSLRGRGRSADQAHGVDVRATWGDVHKYVSKMGRRWGAEDEVTKANTKRGREVAGEVRRFTPFDLLRSVRDTGDPVHAERFREYAEAMKGRRQLRWSPGFRELVGLPKDATDEEIAANPLDDDASAYPLAYLGLTDWAAVRWCGREAIAQLETTGDSGDRAAVLAFVAECRRRYFAEGWLLDA